MDSIIHTWVSLASLISSVIAMAGLFVAISGQRKQFAVQIMLQYSERFRWLIESSPVELIHQNARAEDLPEPDAHLTKHVLQVFFALVELHHLHGKKYLSSSVWDLWMPNVQRLLRSPLFRREWRRHQEDFKEHKAFCNFIAFIQKEEL